MATRGGTDMSAHSHGGHPHGGLDNPDTSHEHGDINVRAVIGFISALTVITLVIQVAMWGLLRGLQHYERTNEPYVSPLAAASSLSLFSDIVFSTL